MTTESKVRDKFEELICNLVLDVFNSRCLLAVETSSKKLIIQVRISGEVRIKNTDYEVIGIWTKSQD